MSETVTVYLPDGDVLAYTTGELPDHPYISTVKVKDIVVVAPVNGSAGRALLIKMPNDSEIYHYDIPFVLEKTPRNKNTVSEPHGSQTQSDPA